MLSILVAKPILSTPNIAWSGGEPILSTLIVTSLAGDSIIYTVYVAWSVGKPMSSPINVTCSDREAVLSTLDMINTGEYLTFPGRVAYLYYRQLT